MEVSHHSLLRWRERVATYGDENGEAVRRKIEEAIKLQGKPPIGFSWYEVDGVNFLVETNHRRSEIVTVINDRSKENDIVLTLSKKQARLKRLGITPNTKVYREEIPEPVIDETIKKYEAIFNSLLEEHKRSWLKDGVQKIQKLPTKEERKKHVNLQIWIESKLRLLKKGIQC